MTTYSSQSIPLLFDFNVVISNLNKVSKDEAFEIIAELKSTIVSSVKENEKYAVEYANIPFVGRTIIEQQILLYNSLLDWLDTFEKQFKQEL